MSHGGGGGGKDAAVPWATGKERGILGRAVGDGVVQGVEDAPRVVCELRGTQSSC